MVGADAVSALFAALGVIGTAYGVADRYRMRRALNEQALTLGIGAVVDRVEKLERERDSVTRPAIHNLAHDMTQTIGKIDALERDRDRLEKEIDFLWSVVRKRREPRG